MSKRRPEFYVLPRALCLAVTLILTTGVGHRLSADDVQAVAPEKLERFETEEEANDAVKREPLERDLDQAVEIEAEEEAGGGVIEMLLNAFRPAEQAPEFEEVQANLRPFMPALNQALTIEIHYLRKVCNPGEEELKQIRAAGEKKILELARLVAKNQHQAFQNGKKSGRELLQEGLLASAKQVLPAEKYESYRKELEARQAARLRGACEMMTLNVDHTLSFPLDDYDEVVQILTENPQPEWNNTMQVFFYRDYCPLPSTDLIKSVLNERQQKIWSSKARRHSGISFGWPANFGLQQWGLNVQLKELEDYSREVDDE